MDGEKRGLDRGGEGMVPLLLNGGVLRETEIKFQNGGEKKKKSLVMLLGLGCFILILC